ncbi:MAG: hypothetical protein L7S64_07385, partial [Longimicrobiales bacterium]|nr:hypothetical protein [Longimicrobiales bacterium]
MALVALFAMIGCGPEDGPFEAYFESCGLLTRGTYLDGQFDGLYERFYESGGVQRIGSSKGLSRPE